jgi:nucleoside-diphosphate kinase
MEQTLIMLKPNAFAQGNIGEIIHRIEKAKFKILAMKMFYFSSSLAQSFYAEHKEKSFFESLIQFMTSGPTLAMVVCGNDAVIRMRKLVGATDPAKADPGAIRHDYAPNATQNVIHASDSLASVEREKKILFNDSDYIME